MYMLCICLYIFKYDFQLQKLILKFDISNLLFAASPGSLLLLNGSFESVSFRLENSCNRIIASVNESFVEIFEPIAPVY